MGNREVLILLGVGVVAATWYFSIDNQPIGESIVVTDAATHSPSRNAQPAGSDAAGGGNATVARVDAGASISPSASVTTGSGSAARIVADDRVNDAAGRNEYLSGVPASATAAMARQVTDAIERADASVNSGGSDDMAKVMEDGKSSSVEEDKQQATESVSYQVLFKSQPAGVIGAVDLVLNWDAHHLTPMNRQSVCVDNSGAMLFQQGLVTSSSANFALLYPNGMGATSTLLTCHFMTQADGSALDALPKVGGELLDIQGSVVGNLAAALLVTR